jgi:AraC-like DNA-binding protein
MALHSESDLLSRILADLRLSAEIFAHAEYCGMWRLDTSGAGRAAFHLIGRGSCWLHHGGQAAPVPLQSGDLILFPRDAQHEIRPARHPEEGSDSTTTILCGYFDFGEYGHNPILDALPDFIHVPAEHGPEAGSAEIAMRLLLSEARRQQPGRQLVLDRFAEGLFVMVLRHVLAQSEDRRGLLAALSDPRLSHVLDVVHRKPKQPWTVESLAHEAAMSRTAFSVTFRERVGMPPMRYLMELRMRMADRLLRERRVSVARVAEEVGYADETAFRRAYSRFFGIGPGAARSTRGVNAETA